LFVGGGGGGPPGCANDIVCVLGGVYVCVGVGVNG
jgi:hypothetical protein